jgi:hypothetical protein
LLDDDVLAFKIPQFPKSLSEAGVKWVVEVRTPTRYKAWGFNGKQVRRYKAEWTQDDAEAELAKALLKIEPEKPKGPGITLAQAAELYLSSDGARAPILKRCLGGSRHARPPAPHVERAH